MRMLVVDDEEAIANMLAEFFRMEGYEVTAAGSGAAALEAVSSGLRPDIILLDVNMPGMDGFEVCRRIRAHLSCPIIFLTARIEDVDQLDGFAAGADDYVLKPFSLEVLGRRVAAHMAREGRAHERSSAVRFFRELTIDYGERTVEVRPASSGGAAASTASSSAGSHAAVGGASGRASAGAHTGRRPAEQESAPSPAAGEPAVRTPAPAAGESAAHAPAPASGVLVDLTRLEFDILALLSKRPGQVFDRDVIYERVWGWEAAGDPAQVREHIRRIRNKLASAGMSSDPIETVWGVGYKWVAR